jgi:tight adherence protein B
MRRLFASVGLLAVFVGFPSVATGSSPGELELTESGGARFPNRAYVLTLPSQASLDPSRVHVRENGKPVSGLSVVPIGAAGGNEAAIVLVIDASRSMRGSAITSAMAAARALAEHREPNQKLAVVTFNSGSSVLLPFSTDEAEIDAALATKPTLVQGTRIYDAVETAVSLISEQDIVSSSIVVLSDGTDTGSREGLDSVAIAARNAHARIFTVGLASEQFTPTNLERLAVLGAGSYSEATSPDELTPIYDALGARLASEYVLRYRSSAERGDSVHVSVKIDGLAGGATSRYVAPVLTLDPTAPFHRSARELFWLSAAAMVAVSLVAAGLLALGLLALLRPRRQSLRRRLAEFVSLAPAGGDRQSAIITNRVFDGAERSLQRSRWWGRFKEELEIAEIEIAPVQIALWSFVGMIFVMWILYIVGLALLMPLGVGVPLSVRALVRRRLERRRKLFADQLPDNLQVLASALRAGHSFVGALSVVVDDAADPARTEFGRVIADEQLGVPLEDALEVVAGRMDNRDLEQVALLAALQRQTGGNSAEVLDRVTETIRERFELRRLVKTLTAQGRMSRWVVSLLPVFLVSAITLLNPEYMEPLYTHPVGRLLLFLAGVMVVVGSIVIKRIVSIKV